MNSSIRTKENTIEETMKITPLEESLQLQIKNYKNQINVLQKKIEYYENEHFPSFIPIYFICDESIEDFLKCSFS